MDEERKGINFGKIISTYSERALLTLIKKCADALLTRKFSTTKEEFNEEE